MSLSYTSSKLSVEKLLISDNTSNSASGEYGEVIASGPISDTGTSTNDSETDVTGASISLTAGHWLICYGGNVLMNCTNAAGSPQSISARIRATDNSNAAVSGTAAYTQYRTEANIAANNFVRAWVSSTTSLLVSTTTTYKLRVTGKSSSGTFSVSFEAADEGNFTGSDNDPYFYAVRIR